MDCVICKDVKDTYLLPCLHSTCAKCIAVIVQETRQNKRKATGCRECGEVFVQDLLPTVPRNNGSSVRCGDCSQAASFFCCDCNKNLCKDHGDGHLTTVKFKGHVIEQVDDVPVCQNHPSATAIAFCTSCKVLACGDCAIHHHNQSPHTRTTLEEAIKSTTDAVKRDVAKLRESLPTIDKEIKKYTDIRTKLEKERAELETKIADIRNQEKVAILQIEDLEKTKALFLTAETQANTLAAIGNTISQAPLLQLQTVVATRVSQLQAGLGLINSAPSTTIPPLTTTIFNRTGSTTVSENGNTLTNTTGIWGYGISDDGCSRGVRSWRITVNSINANTYEIMFGIWNSSKTPSTNNSYADPNAWLVQLHNGSAYVNKSGSSTSLNSPSPLQSGDIILLSIDCNQHRLTVQNTTRKWTHSIDLLPPPNPFYYPHVLLKNQNQSVTIEAVSS